MLYKNSLRYIKKNVDIFGSGEVFKQIKPLLVEEGINIDNIFDDTFFDDKYDINKYSKKENLDLLYCVGYSNMEERYLRFKELKSLRCSFLSYISNNAIISVKSKVGNGVIINQGVIIDNFVEIGECVFINIGAMISHHSIIKDNVFIAPGVNIAGYVTVDEGVFIGTNATIIDNVVIGKGALVAAGSVVIKDVPPYSMVAGNPAEVKKKLK